MHLVPEKVGESQIDVGLQEEAISMKREDGLRQDQVSLRILENDGESFEGHREMMKDVQSSLLVMKEILGHRERMRVPGLASGVKGRDFVCVKESRRKPRHHLVSRTVKDLKATVALDNEG